MGNRTLRSCITALIIVVICFVGFAFAQEDAVQIYTRVDTDPGTFAHDLYLAFTAKEWGIFVGGLIMLVVWFTRLFVLVKIPACWLPFVSSAMGVLLSISIDLTSKVSWWKAVLNGLLVGSAASGMWSMIGKKVLPSDRKNKENPDDPGGTGGTGSKLESTKPVGIHDAPTVPKMIVVMNGAGGSKVHSYLDDTAVMDEVMVRKLLEDEDTEPGRKVVVPDDTKPSS